MISSWCLAWFRSIIVGAALCLVGCQDSSLSPGSLAPELSVVSLDGETRKLSDFRGKVVVLNFLASWCTPCATEMPSLERLHKALSGQGLSVVAVGVDDDLEGLKSFQSSYHTTFPFLMDSKGTASGRYRLGGFPETFVLDRDGRFVMLVDPATQQPTLKFIGPREWDSPTMRASLEALLRRG